MPDHRYTLEMPELELFIDELWITDVLYELKSGKEATAYCCSGGPTSGLDLIAAKLYRPIETRGFRNDNVYHAGRWDAADRRTKAAVASKSKVGMEMRFSSWVEHEYRTLELLHAAGTGLICLAGRGVLECHDFSPIGRVPDGDLVLILVRVLDAGRVGECGDEPAARRVEPPGVPGRRGD